MARPVVLRRLLSGREGGPKDEAKGEKRRKAEARW